MTPDPIRPVRQRPIVPSTPAPGPAPPGVAFGPVRRASCPDAGAFALPVAAVPFSEDSAHARDRPVRRRDRSRVAPLSSSDPLEAPRSCRPKRSTSNCSPMPDTATAIMCLSRDSLTRAGHRHGCSRNSPRRATPCPDPPILASVPGTRLLQLARDRLRRHRSRSTPTPRAPRAGSSSPGPSSRRPRAVSTPLPTPDGGPLAVRPNEGGGRPGGGGSRGRARDSAPVQPRMDPLRFACRLHPTR